MDVSLPMSPKTATFASRCSTMKSPKTSAKLKPAARGPQRQPKKALNQLKSSGDPSTKQGAVEASLGKAGALATLERQCAGLSNTLFQRSHEVCGPWLAGSWSLPAQTLRSTTNCQGTPHLFYNLMLNKPFQGVPVLPKPLSAHQLSLVGECIEDSSTEVATPFLARVSNPLHVQCQGCLPTSHVNVAFARAAIGSLLPHKF